MEFGKVSILSDKVIVADKISIINGEVGKPTPETVNVSAKGITSNTKPIVFSFKEESTLNKITIEGRLQGLRFALFYSESFDRWQRIAARTVKLSGVIELEFPLVATKNLKLVVRSNSNAMSELLLSKITLLKKVDVKISATTELSRLWVKENLTDGRTEYGWASLDDTEHEINLDLGIAFYLSEIQLRATKKEFAQFPENFAISFSDDNINFYTCISEGEFFASSLSWYKWLFQPIRARYIRINIYAPKKSRILELAAFAIAENYLVTRVRSEVALATEMLPGTVTLAGNNSYTPNKVVQGNDSRLQPANTETKGIVQLARDGSTEAEKVVQGNDRRLKAASETMSGIVQLARNNESRQGTAVQSNDDRLKLSGEENAGIVQLAKDGESRHGLALQSHDARLKSATTSNPGIVQIAEDGSTENNKVIQGSDQRLRVSSIAWPGITQLAKHNEQATGKALQSDDPRLCEGDENQKGRVQFARNGEAVSGKALQSNDSRLNAASKESMGLVQLAKPGSIEPNKAITGDDPRLSDERKPSTHTHDYAEKKHDLNSHVGKLNLDVTTKTAPDPEGFHVGPMHDLPLSSKNTEGVAAGFSGGLIVDGSVNPAVSAKSRGHEAITGLSSDRSAAVFLSEKDYSLKLPSSLSAVKSSGKSLYVEGSSLFKETLNVEHSLTLAIQWNKISNEAFAEGDLLAVHTDGYLEKLKSTSQSCVGVCVSNTAIKLGPQKGKKSVMVAISGICLVRISGKVNAGSRIGFIGGDPGVGFENSPETSTVAISLENSSQTSERLVWSILK